MESLLSSAVQEKLGPRIPKSLGGNLGEWKPVASEQRS